MLNLKLLNRIRNLTANKALVLMYHRIADLTTNPWQMGVSPCNFEQQLKVLQTKYKLISVADLIIQLSRKSITSNTVCITFDDGYSDNYLTAKPLLEKYQCPATFFISTQYVEQQKSFWWDELEEIILSSEILPEEFSITIDGKLFEFQLKDDLILTNEQKEKQKNWVWTDKPPTRRCQLYLAVWERLRSLPYIKQQSVIENIKSWGNYREVVKENLPMTNQQLYDLARQPLSEIGLHTVTHPVLSLHSREVQIKEIADNQQFLKENCPNLISVIAYPFGNYSEITLSVVKKRGLKAAFTTGEQPVTHRSNLLALSRFQVKNWNGDEFETRLSQWMKGA